MELGTPVGFTESRAQRLAWASDGQHRLANLSGEAGRRKVQLLADYATRMKFSSIIAPTHFVQDAADPLFGIDQRLTEELRRALDQRAGRDITIQYALAVPSAAFYDEGQRASFKAAISHLPVDSLRLRIHPFGNSSGHVSLLRYIHAARDLISLDLPLIAERVGNIGLALLAFGAVSGVESGVTFGDKFDINTLRRPPTGMNGFVAPRVYIPELGAFVPKKTAQWMLTHSRLRSLVVCKNSNCCARGEDMVARSRRHFVFNRIGEVDALNRPPAQQRPTEYLERMLRPATDRLMRVLQIEFNDARLKTKLEHERDKQAGWRGTLGELTSQPLLVVPRTPARRTSRDARSARR
jgi:hypothetical protein